MTEIWEDISLKSDTKNSLSVDNVDILSAGLRAQRDQEGNPALQERCRRF